MEQESDDKNFDLEQERLKLDRYKAKLDYRKFLLGSVFVAIAIAAIPPLFQLATAALEYVKSNAERENKQQVFRDEYVKEFISNALNQDIELRIRFAQYFAHVATEPSRKEWGEFLNDLKQSRDEIRGKIDKLEADWQAKSREKNPDIAELDKIKRNLAWYYKEVGYLEPNRSAAVDPRLPEKIDSVVFSPPASSSPASEVKENTIKTQLLDVVTPWNGSTQTGKLSIPIEPGYEYVSHRVIEVSKNGNASYIDRGLINSEVVLDYNVASQGNILDQKRSWLKLELQVVLRPKS